MSWKEFAVVRRRLEFVKLALRGQSSMAELCREYRFSRKTGYKWKARFEAHGVAGLGNLKRRPRRLARQISAAWVPRVRRLRRRHRTWGRRKLYARLCLDYPGQKVPAVQTIGDWLRRLGLNQRRRRRPRRGPQLARRALTNARRSNQVWTVDFKGWFRTQDGRRVDPLTVRDLFSRYLLSVRLLAAQSWRTVRRIFMRLFRRYGYPTVIRVDNGSPFGSPGPAGLSRLSAWWTLVGIRVEFITPGHPQENGAHEQMHRILKAETTLGPSRHRAAQQRRTDRWVRIYNCVRPHEGLGQRTPKAVYRPRPGLPRPLQPRYGRGWATRQVRSNGQIKWRGRKRFVGEAFIGYAVGLRPVGQGKSKVYFGRLLIGELWPSDPGGMRPARYQRRLTRK